MMRSLLGIIGGWVVPAAVGLGMAASAWGASPPEIGLPQGSGSGLAGPLLKMGTSLAAVLGLMVLAVYLLRRFGGRRFGGAIGRDRIIRILGNQYLGGKSQVSVVEVEGERFLLGVCPERVTLLGRLGGRSLDGSPSQRGTSFETTLRSQGEG